MEQKGGMLININGKQVNIAKDNATINVIQNNRMDEEELGIIVKGIMDNLSELKREDADRIVDAIDIAKEELSKPTPKVSRLRNCVTLIAPLLTIANGAPILLNNLQKLLEYIGSYIH